MLVNRKVSSSMCSYWEALRKCLPLCKEDIQNLWEWKVLDKAKHLCARISILYVFQLRVKRSSCLIINKSFLSVFVQSYRLYWCVVKGHSVPACLELASALLFLPRSQQSVLTLASRRPRTSVLQALNSLVNQRWYCQVSPFTERFFNMENYLSLLFASE